MAAAVADAVAEHGDLPMVRRLGADFVKRRPLADVRAARIDSAHAPGVRADARQAVVDLRHVGVHRIDERRPPRRRVVRRAGVELERIARRARDADPVVDGIEKRRAVAIAVLREHDGTVVVLLVLRRVERRVFAPLADGLPVKADGAHTPVNRLFAEIRARNLAQRRVVMVRIDGARRVDAVLALIVRFRRELDLVDDGLRVPVPREERRVRRRLRLRRLPQPREPLAHGAFHLLGAGRAVQIEREAAAERDGEHDERRQRFPLRPFFCFQRFFFHATSIA